MLACTLTPQNEYVDAAMMSCNVCLVCVYMCVCASVRQSWNCLYVIKGLLFSDNSVLPLLLNMLRVEI